MAVGYRLSVVGQEDFREPARFLDNFEQGYLKDFLARNRKPFLENV
ncbi:MAG: hypothetical protein OXG97_14675 [Candidatus Poribacteria bacterium]|nr:hypothetical protein [Candidatus Poribacteria bacterium]